MNGKENDLLIEIRSDVKTILVNQGKHSQWIRDHEQKTKEQNDKLGNCSRRIGLLERWRSMLTGLVVGIPSLGMLLFFLIKFLLEK